VVAEDVLEQPVLLFCFRPIMLFTKISTLLNLAFGLSEGLPTRRETGDISISVGWLLQPFFKFFFYISRGILAFGFIFCVKDR